jgi:hypothetical protein
MSALNSVSSHSDESWRRVSAIAQLADIFDPAMQVCSWQRTIDSNLTFYATEAAGHGTQQIMEMLKTGDRAKLADLPADEGRELLQDDVALLTEILCELVDCPCVGVRYASVENAMCPRWHVDHVPIRLLCTYAGPGTEWLDNQGVDKRKLSDPEIAAGACQRAVSGEVVLLKGALWQGNTGFGAIHRSPAMAPGEQPRMLLTLDPMWPV